MQRKASPKKILIIDDEPDLVRLVGDRLRMQKYEVVGASNGIEGLKKAVSEKPDLILLDILMPGMDGHAVLKRLKSSSDTDSIPVIMLTAKSQSKDVETARKAGAEDFVAKPFDYTTLISKIKRHI